MRNFLFLLLCFPSLSYAQDTIARHENEKFMVFANIGLNIPEGEYGVPDVLNSSPSSTEVYGYSKSDLHTNVTGVFIPAKHIGLVARYGLDINQANEPNSISSQPLKNVVNQYLVGIDILVNPKQSSFNVYFLGLIGRVTANIPNPSNGFSTSGPFGEESGYEVPGFGVGVGLYAGIGLSSSISKDIFLNFSLGYLNSTIYFQSGTTTTYTTLLTGPPPSYSSSYTSVSHSAMQMNMGIIQGTIGLSYLF